MPARSHSLGLGPRRRERLPGGEWAVSARAGHGPTCLLLHGFTGTSRDFDAVVPALGDRALLAPDLPGHGRSAAASPMLAHVRAGLLALVARLGPVDVLGYSQGGRLALDLACTQPGRIRRLVLIGASPGLPPAEAETRRVADERLAQHLETIGVRAFLSEWSTGPLFTHLAERCDPIHLATLRHHRSEAKAAGLAAALRSYGTGAVPYHGDSLAARPCPVLLLAGAEDTKFTAIAQSMAEQLPRAQIEVVAGAGHACHLERPDVVGPRIARFLND